jgi:uncharacterized repeat protein (TIGR04138 family)
MPTERPTKSLKEVADAVAVYPMEAYEFVERGLSFTVARIHGAGAGEEPRHVTGKQLCEGLRDYALMQWGLLARTVLTRWSIFTTLDFGRIVFGLVDHNRLKTTQGDTLEDFRNIYDFRTAFESGYRIECKV